MTYAKICSGKDGSSIEEEGIEVDGVYISLFVLALLLSDFDSSFVDLCDVLSNKFKDSFLGTVIGGFFLLKDFM